jgi:curli production assembly/transport component CsgG
MRCDSLWKGPGDYVWCGKPHGIQGHPDVEVDMIRTFQIQAAVNELIDKSLDDFGKKNWDQVISATSAAISMEPTNEVAYTNRAGAYTYKGLYEEAIKDCNKAIQLNPNFGLAYNNRGFAFERMGRLEQALSEYEMSCRLRNNLGCSNYERLRSKIPHR